MIAFAPLTAAHLPLLHGWLQRPHVRAFWDDGDRTLEQVRAHYFRPDRDVLAFVLTWGGEAMGYVQAYPVGRDSTYAAWRAPQGETWGMDLFIGEVAALGQGRAVPVIRAFLTHLRAVRPGLRRVLIDPETRNGRARHVYARAGFMPLATVEVGGQVLALLGLECGDSA